MLRAMGIIKQADTVITTGVSGGLSNQAEINNRPEPYQWGISGIGTGLL